MRAGGGGRNWRLVRADTDAVPSSVRRFMARARQRRLRAALRTLREVAGDGRLLVVFQPYRVYRTRDLQAELAEGLAIADEAIVMEVFGPGEVRGPGEGGVSLTAAIHLPADRKVFVPSWEDVPAEVVRRSRPGDVVVTMGAPPISLMGDELLAALNEGSA